MNIDAGTPSRGVTEEELRPKFEAFGQELLLRLLPNFKIGDQGSNESAFTPGSSSKRGAQASRYTTYSSCLSSGTSSM